MKYVKVHPALTEKPATDDFENGSATWSYVIKDANGDRVLFGDYSYNVNVFDLNFLRLRLVGQSNYRVFTWAQARELGETIIALADKYEGRG